MPLSSRILARSLLVIGLVAGSAAAPAAASDWPMVGGGPAHEGVADGPEPPYVRAWTAELKDAGALAGPVVAGDLVVVVAAKRVIARSAADGAAVWDLPREPGPVVSPAVGGDALIYVEGRGPKTVVRAVTLADGAERWGYATLAGIEGAPTAAGPNVLVASRDGTIHALDLESGQAVWSFRAAGRAVGSPAAAGDLVLAVSEDLTNGRARVYGLDASSGLKRWEFSPKGPALGASSVSIRDDLAVVGLGDFATHALDLRNGVERWLGEARAAFAPALAPALPGDVVIGDRAGHLYRLDARNGEERWVFRVPGDLLEGSALVTGGAVVVGDGAGQVSAIDLDSGRLVWKEDLGGALGAAAADGEHIYLAAGGGRLVALAHDPAGRLLDEASPTTLFAGRALTNFGLAFAGVTLGLVGAFRGLRGRARRGGSAT